ncbi:hypothetical protein ATY81_12370 [Rhizobium sp. R72]|uniref:hypothetical protein n=1 Tax=unclassified Rhizobium TaxID=2613769 RepID=UPI000B531DE4|nr:MULTISPECIES: hypothetical protein [unclassified Rhizobium]OWV94240.1 hypothetical protein ATY81_12370 [Rhizobium sp. R72]OWV94510.1 hypothetical protein ATY80_12370 [Rhizobium sp. R711]
MQAEILAALSPAAKFNLALKLENVTLPLRHESENVGTIVDATGRGFVVVDMHRELPDAQVTEIAELIVLAVNAQGGFPASVEMRGAA